MRLIKNITIFLTLSLLLNFCASSKKTLFEKNKKSISISSILKAAKCPLSQEQEKKLEEFTIKDDRGASWVREAFWDVDVVFDEKQLEILKETFGSMPGKNNGPERPRFLFFAIIFENGNCPFTERQLKELQALPNSNEAFQHMQDIFSEKQNEIIKSIYNR